VNENQTASSVNAGPTESDQQAPAASGAPAETPTFDVLPLSDEVRRALEEMGYKHPTPVQVAVFEPATRGKDAVVQARTGTGKTASFGLPIVDHIIRRSVGAPQALVLCPTRELALQVSAEVERLGKYRDVKVLPIYGGASMERQLQGIQAGAQLIVGTPGRVLDHIRRGTLPVAGIKLLVLDEADEMLSMGFERELSAILESLPPSRQTLLFSATLPPDIERIARNKLKEPEFLTLSGDHIGALEIAHYAYLVKSDKIGALVRILEAENPESAVIFCNTREETETVAHALSQRGYDADWLNGDLPQSDRERVMSATRQGKLRYLVATDVAARGIDISHLTHVINYDFPMDAEAYVHRTGRTGRAGRTGTAIALITPQDVGSLYYLRLTYKIRPIERQIPTAEELRTRAEADLLAMLAETLLPKGIDGSDRALARRLLAHDQCEMLVAGLLRAHLEKAPGAQQEAERLRRQPPRRASMRRRDEGEGREGRSDRRGPPPERPLRRSEGGSSEGVSSGAPTPRFAPPSAPEAPVVTPGPAATPAPEGAPGRGSRDRERPRRDRDRDRDRAPRAGGREGGRGQRAEAAREFANWSPPEEEGDDEPLLPARADRDAGRDAGRDDRREDRRGGRGSSERRGSSEGRGGAPELHAEPPARPGGSFEEDDAPYAELFLGVGRRDGARAQDVLRALVEQAGLDKDHVRRIRVRDRHTFAGVRKDDAERAIAALNGNAIAGKSAVTVELARERPTDDSLSA
jgi:ATP-dependent RNA helicase DeaD